MAPKGARARKPGRTQINTRTYGVHTMSFSTAFEARGMHVPMGGQREK